MRISLRISDAGLRVSARHFERGFTLPELLIALTIFLMMIGGIIVANLFGLRIYQTTETKLNATQWSRETLMRLSDEIHSCNGAAVGTISNGTFMAFLDGETQQGSALLINPTTDTNSFILYFVDGDDQTFRRGTEQPGSTTILASCVTNALPFSAQDFLGNILTNNANNQVIHFCLEIYQPNSFMLSADYYKLESSIKQRVVP